MLKDDKEVRPLYILRVLPDEEDSEPEYAGVSIAFEDDMQLGNDDDVELQSSAVESPQNEPEFFYNSKTAREQSEDAGVNVFLSGGGLINEKLPPVPEPELANDDIPYLLKQNEGIDVLTKKVFSSGRCCCWIDSLETSQNLRRRFSLKAVHFLPPAFAEDYKLS